MKKLHNIIIVVLLLFAGISVYAQDTLRLEKVIVVSRHGARAPLDKYLQDLATLTPCGNDWYQWKDKGVNGSDLTPRGAALETIFGNYFRLWFHKHNFTFQANEVYFGASSKQRTIATARAFAAGLMPLTTIPIDYKTDANGNYGPLDPDYLPLFNDRSTTGFDVAAFQKEARKELCDKTKAPSYDFLEKILDYKHSPRAQQTGSTHFNKYVDVQLDFYDKDGKMLEPTMLGDLNIANKASDAFILQYYERYEMDDSLKASFMHKLSTKEWEQLANIKDYYGEILFTAPIIAVNVSHCMLKRVKTEMVSPWHKLAFFCTHDSMIQALLAALRVEKYELDNTIEKQTPIGFKLVIEQWLDTKSCERLVKVKLVYQSSEQVSQMTPLNLTNPPQEYELSFTGLKKKANGYYPYTDFMNHIEETLNAYSATACGKNPFSE